jgi:hypothetical protein
MCCLADSNILVNKDSPMSGFVKRGSTTSEASNSDSGDSFVGHRSVESENSDGLLLGMLEQKIDRLNGKLLYHNTHALSPKG